MGVGYGYRQMNRREKWGEGLPKHMYNKHTWCGVRKLVTRTVEAQADHTSDLLLGRQEEKKTLTHYTIYGKQWVWHEQV